MQLKLKNTRHMACPRCGDRLSAVDRAGIEIDVCRRCLGSWFDQLEIEALLRTKRDLSNYVPPGRRQWVDSHLSCPLCSRPMRTLLKNTIFPFDIDMCPVDKGYWFDGSELDQIVSVGEKRTLRLKTRDTAAEDTMQRQIAQRQVERIQHRYANREHQEPDALALENTSFFELSGPQQLLAMVGLPVESGGFYERRSWANALIILGNVAVFGWMLYAAGSFLGLLGLFPKQWYMQFGLVPSALRTSPFSEGHTLVTSMFMHGGIVHLLGNMFFLFTTGDDVEKRLGHIRYLCFYLLAGIVASLVSVLAGRGAGIPHVGASGAIAGVMGAYLALCRHKSFYVWILRVGIFGKMISVSAWLYLAFWFGSQLLSLKFGNPGIDYWAHIGGFVFGFTAGKIVAATQSFNCLTGRWEWRRRKNTV